MIELTEEQRQEIREAGEPFYLTDPDTKQEYVLLRAESYAKVRDILEEERTRQAIAKVARRNAAGRIQDEP